MKVKVINPAPSVRMVPRVPEDLDRLIIENADIIERLAKCKLLMVDNATGECFKVQGKRLIQTGKFVNFPRKEEVRNGSQKLS